MRIQIFKRCLSRMAQVPEPLRPAQKADLAILCHRHTTSKLKEYEDLETIGTLGFRSALPTSQECLPHYQPPTFC